MYIKIFKKCISKSLKNVYQNSPNRHHKSKKTEFGWDDLEARIKQELSKN